MDLVGFTISMTILFVAVVVGEFTDWRFFIPQKHIKTA